MSAPAPGTTRCKSISYRKMDTNRECNAPCFMLHELVYPRRLQPPLKADRCASSKRWRAGGTGMQLRGSASRSIVWQNAGRQSASVEVISKALLPGGIQSLLDPWIYRYAVNWFRSGDFAQCLLRIRRIPIARSVSNPYSRKLMCHPLTTR